MCAMAGGCKACDLMGALGNCSKELFRYKGKVLIEALLGDKSAVGNFLVDVIVVYYSWGGL